MKKLTVFIETSIPSFHVDTRRSATISAWREATRSWWEYERRRFRTVTSAAVIAELARSPGSKAEQMLLLMDEVEVLDDPPGMQPLIEHYIRVKVMPRGAQGDAAHLAFASLVGADFLLTWNCRHLANANKFKHIAVINHRLKLPIPTLCTPLSLQSGSQNR